MLSKKRGVTIKAENIIINAFKNKFENFLNSSLKKSYLGFRF